MAALGANAFCDDLVACGGVVDGLLLGRVPAAHGDFSNLVNGSEFWLELVERFSVSEAVGEAANVGGALEIEGALAVFFFYEEVVTDTAGAAPQGKKFRLIFPRPKLSSFFSP